MLITLVTTLVTVFGASTDPGGSTVALGVVALVALAAVAAVVSTLTLPRPGTDSGAARTRSGSIRRRAASVGVVVVRDPDARGRTRPRAPDAVAVPA